MKWAMYIVGGGGGGGELIFFTRLIDMMLTEHVETKYFHMMSLVR